MCFKKLGWPHDELHHSRHLQLTFRQTQRGKPRYTFMRHPQDPAFADTRHPAVLEEMTQQRRSHRPSQMRTPFRPIQAAPSEGTPARTQFVNFDAMLAKPFTATRCYLVIASSGCGEYPL